MRYFYQIICLLAFVALVTSGCRKDPSCSDGKQNQGELGVDCCGPCNPCNNLPCIPGFTPSCSDGVQNGDETNVDCGGDCPICGPLCNDGVMNGDETGVDCGGSNCQDCSTPANCVDGILNGQEEGIDCGGACPACGSVNTCANGVQDGNETGVDCGGPCTACVAGPSCSDGIQNQGEAGIDCGGPCTDCPEPTCTDGIQNGTETGVDCGGTCNACPEPTCTDGIQNGTETGVDCGGDCPACVAAPFSAVIDGTSWSTDFVSAQVTIGSLMMMGTNDNFTILITFGGTFAPGTYPTSANVNLQLQEDLVPCGSSPGSGSITFTTFDTVNKVVSGTFNFTCTGTGGSSTITEGAFNNITYL